MDQGRRSRQFAIRAAYCQRQVTGQTIYTYVCILYLKYEDAILAILCMSLIITTSITGKWLNSLLFHYNNKCITANGRTMINGSTNKMFCITITDYA